MPGIETRELSIGDCVYRVTQLGSKTGNKVLLRLSKPLGASFKLAQGGADLDLDIGAGIAALTDDDFAFVCDALAESTRVIVPDEGNAPKMWALKMIFDQHFAGRYAEELQWLLFAIEVNFGNFFGDLAAMLARRAAGSRSTSRPTPSGSSGVSSAAANASG